VSRVPKLAVGLCIVATTIAASAAARDGAPFVRGCESSVWGDLGRDWRKRAVVAGPVAFVSVREYARQPRATFARSASGRYQPLKVLIVVEPRVTATVVVPKRARHAFRLVYDHSLFNRLLRISEAHWAVRFEACPTPQQPEPWNRGTQFNGGFLVAAPGCRPLEVRVEGRGSVIRRVVSFGVGTCRTA
jgi:hypothetical protein